MSTDTPDTETPDAGPNDVETLDTPSPETVTPDAVNPGGASADEGSADQNDVGPTEAAATTDATARPGKPSRREALEAEGDVAADFLEALLDIADIVGDIDVDIDGDRAAVSIVDSDEGRVPRRLVGPDGKVLEALQELTRLAVQTETGERSRLMLDVAGHRAGRRAELVEVAQAAIAAVRESGDRTALDPMTAFERKVV